MLGYHSKTYEDPLIPDDNVHALVQELDRAPLTTDISLAPLPITEERALLEPRESPT